jgi:hypothetical protein
MGSSSFLNALRTLRRKPMLLLLLMPLHFATPLVGKLLHAPIITTDSSAISSVSGMMNLLADVMPYILGICGSILLLYLVAGFFLVPPALELLQDGAAGAETPAGWYGRGLKKYWWKPVSLGILEVVFCGLLVMIFSIFISFIQLAGSPGMSSIGSFAFDSPLGILMLAVALILAFILYFIISAFALLLPAVADRDFNDAFRAVFSGFGLKKTMKVFGAFLLADIVSFAFYFIFEIGFILLNGPKESLADLSAAMALFSASWTSYCASVLMSFSILFKYAFVFSVFREIKGREQQAEASGLRVSWRS